MPPTLITKQLSIYPTDLARYICGGSNISCNQAVENWAHQLKSAMPELERKEWNFLADIFSRNEIPKKLSGGEALADLVKDAQELAGMGVKWLNGKERVEDNVHPETVAFVEKVKKLRWEKVAYILAAVAFYWSRSIADHEIDIEKDDWWTIGFRCRLLKKIEEEGGGGE